MTKTEQDSNKKSLILDSYLLEIGKLAGYSQSLRDEAEKSSVNRHKCKRMMFDIMASIAKINVQIDSLSPFVTIKNRKRNDGIKETYYNAIKKLAPVAQKIDDEKSATDNDVRNL